MGNLAAGGRVFRCNVDGCNVTGAAISIFQNIRICLKRRSQDFLQRHLTLEVLEKSGRGEGRGGREVLTEEREEMEEGGECQRRK